TDATPVITMNIEATEKRKFPESVILLFCGILIIPATLSLFFSNSPAQWVKTAAVVFPNLGASGGSLHFKDGVLWGGSKQVLCSLDTGKTWTVSLASVATGESIMNIDFFDSRTGLVRTSNYLYITQDGGANWSVQSAPGNTGSRYSCF